MTAKRRERLWVHLHCANSPHGHPGGATDTVELDEVLPRLNRVLFGWHREEHRDRHGDLCWVYWQDLSDPNFRAVRLTSFNGKAEIRATARRLFFDSGHGATATDIITAVTWLADLPRDPLPPLP